MRSLVPVCALVVALAPPVYAGHWPRPAAGGSSSGDPEVVLTFDDGPHESYTPAILDELAARGLQATFFWVGHRVTGGRKRVSERLEVARRALREGHLIGNHTINHAQLCGGDARTAAGEIDDNERIYERLLGMPLYWFRAPYGAKCDRLERMLSRRGLRHLHWDWDPQEWMHHDAETTFAYVVRKLRHLDGRAVLLMHDTKRAAVRALPRILDWIDQENARRRPQGGRPIRIVSYVELAREDLAPGLESWLRDTAGALTARAELATSLIPGAVAAPSRQARSAP